MVYYINFVIELLAAMILLRGVMANTDLLQQAVMSNDRRKWYCIFCGTLWILISGLRGLSVGADTEVYYYMYLNVKNMSLDRLYQNIILKITSNIGNKDPGYDLFVKLTQVISDDYQVFLVVVAVIFMVPFLIWVWRESKNPLISFALFSSLFYAFFAITGIRQTIATSLIVLIGDRFVKERKLIPFLVVAFFAALIHMSALVFVPFYFLSRIKIRKTTSALAGLAFALAFIFRGTLKNLFISISGYSDYAADYEGAGTYTFTFILIALYILSILSYRKDKNLKNNGRFYVALYLAMFFVPLTFLNPSAMRIVQYFSIYLVLLIPEMIDAVFTKQGKIIATAVAVSMLAVLLIRSNPTYVFFWQ